MMQRLGHWHLPLRLRLTVWYVLTLALILLLSGIALYWQIQHSLLAQVDTTLQLAATQAGVSVDSDDGRLIFQNIEDRATFFRRLNNDTVIFLLDPAGAVWDKLGEDDEIRAFPPQAGFQTFPGEDENWRVYGEPISDPERTINGWVQVTQSLEPVDDTLATLRLQLLWGLPLAMLFSGAGGFFLATRALAPINRITHTAHTISASDLSRRIDYTGPADEVGRLAATFDHMLDRLQVAFERERRFTGDAAHELRTPLAALKGRIGVTLNQSRQPVEYVETLQDMEQQVDRLIRLSNDLLYIARLDQGQLNLRYETVDLGDLLSAIIDQVRPLADSKRITVIETVPSRLVIQGDMDMLTRLFLNLVDNAVKYTPAGGRVQVRAEENRPDVTVTISDTGPGIPAHHLPHLFDRFYRVGSARSRDGSDNERGGAGLGLAIAHEIVNAHRGVLTVESSSEQGTVFTVRLPKEVTFPV